MKAWTIFWFNILNFNILGFFQKNEYFLGYEDFVDIFRGHYKRGHFMDFRVVSKGQGTELGIFFGFVKFHFFFYFFLFGGGGGS